MRRHAKAFVALSALLLSLVLGVSLADAVVPVVSIEDATNVSYTTADVKGEVKPEGQLTTWRFQYATQQQWEDAGNAFPSESLGEGPSGETEAEETLERQLTGLTPDTTYHLRLQAENGDGQSEAVATNTFTTLEVQKPSLTPISVSSLTATSAHFSAEVDPNGTDPAFAAQWSFTCTPVPCKDAQGHPLQGTVPAGTVPKEVKADAANLEPNVEYTVKLTATNAGGSEEETATFETEGSAPSVKAFAAGPIQATQAGINGEVNPHNSPTTYWFEWGTQDCSANPCQSIPASKDADAGSAGADVYVFRQLNGLSPQSTYHFRLIAKNASGTTEGPDQAFTTASPASEAQGPACPNHDALGAEFLPDCRAWEMVSPPDKNGGGVTVESKQVHVATDGEAIAFGSLVGFADAKGSGIGFDYIAERDGVPGTNGWSTHAITPLMPPFTIFAGAFGGLGGNTSQFSAEFSPDLSRAIFRAWRPLEGTPNSARATNVYRLEGLRTPGGASATLMSDAYAPLPPLPPLFYLFAPPWPLAASSDVGHVLFESQLRLSEDAILGRPNIYESSGGIPRLASRIPAGSASTCDDAGGPGSACEAAFGAQAGPTPGQLREYTSHVISSDGSRVFFQTPTGGSGGNLYLREDSTRTYQLNASEKETPESPAGDAKFWDASTDGSRAFFTTAEGLVQEDDDGGQDLYMYEAEKPEGERLTLIGGGLDGSAEGVIGISADGRYVYFFNNDGNAPRIYLWHDGQVALVGALNDEANFLRNTPATTWFAPPIHSKFSRLSADGRHLLFMATSDAGLKGHGGFAGYDHGHGDPERCSSTAFQDCVELYLYSADSGRLQCVSCTPSGAPGTSDAYDSVEGNGVGFRALNRTQHENQALSDDGRFAFFTTAEALVSEDSNGTWDAYVYDTQTEKPHLLSSGEDKDPSYFLDASPDGRDAFIATAQKLSSWDVDDAYDAYDARIGGGLPEPPPTPPACQGDACQPAPRELSDPTPSSSSFKGPDNPAHARKRKRHARKRHHAKKRHSQAHRQSNRDANANRRASR